MQGLLLVNKPSGWTSFDVVNYIRRIVANAEGKKPKNVKVGHTGTLDPLATGLLVILVGKEYTRRAAELSKQDKTYQVTMRLGKTSTTGDDEGEKTVVSDIQPTLEQVTTVLQQFQGDIMQTPPAFSAIKVNGQRAYKLAREGKVLELEARPVTIHSIELNYYNYPEVKFTCRVSSGTYIRSLVEDVGNALQTGAYMPNLKRISIADFDITDAVDVQSLTSEMLSKLLSKIDK